MAVKVYAAVGCLRWTYIRVILDRTTWRQLQGTPESRTAPAVTDDVNISNGLHATRLRIRCPFRYVVYRHC